MLRCSPRTPWALPAPRLRSVGAILAPMVLVCCAPAETIETVTTTSAATTSTASTPTTPAGCETPCPPGHTFDGRGACVPAGIVGCVPEFIHPVVTEDGSELPACIPSELCQPSIADCSAGEIPRFDRGCNAVGVPDCWGDFVHEGICLPSMTDCPGGFAVPRMGCMSFEDGCIDTKRSADIEVHVEAGANPAVADGSATHPFATIAAGVLHAKQNGLHKIGVAAGEYSEDVKLSQGMELTGDCAAKVTITGQFTEGAIRVWNTSAVKISGVRVTGPETGISVRSSENVVVEDVWIDGATAAGLFVVEAGVTMRRSLVQGTKYAPYPAPGPGVGIGVVWGVVQVEDSAVHQNTFAGVYAQDVGTDVLLRDCLVEDTQPDPEGHFGVGVVAHRAVLDVASSVIRRNRTQGLEVQQEDAIGTVEDSVIADTLPDEHDEDHGSAAVVFNKAALTIARSVITDNHDVSILATRAQVPGAPPPDPPTLTLDSNLIQRTKPRYSVMQPAVDGVGGRAVMLQDGAQGFLYDNAIVDNREIAVFALDSKAQGTWLIARGNLVADTRSSEKPGLFGRGFGFEGGAGGELTGNAIVRNQDAGVFLGNPIAGGEHLVCEHNLIASTTPEAKEGDFGAGLICQYGGAVDLAGNAIISNGHAGIINIQDCETTSTGDLVGLTYGSGKEGEKKQQGVGIATGDGATMVMDNDVVCGNRLAGIMAFDGSTSVVHTLVGSTRLGNAELWNGDELEAFADGIVALGPTVNVDCAVVEKCKRGIVYCNSSGKLERTLVLSADEETLLCTGTAPEVGEGNNFDDVSCLDDATCPGFLDDEAPLLGSTGN